MTTDNAMYTYYMENLRKIVTTINVFIKRNETGNGNQNSDKFEEVKKYKDLLDNGIISQDEYEKKRTSESLK